MGKIRVDDDFLYQYMPALGEKIAQAYPEEEKLVHEFSEEFEKKMKKLIKRARYKEWYGIPISTAKRIAAMILVALIVFLLTAVHTKAFPMERIIEKLFSYQETVYDKETDRRFEIPEGKAGEFVPLHPTYIPEGYELVIEDGDDTFSYLSYEKSETDGFFIQQEQVLDGMIVSDDNEYIKEEKTKIHGYPGSISYKEDGQIHIRWESDSTLYWVAADQLSKDELIKICEGLK